MLCIIAVLRQEVEKEVEAMRINCEKFNKSFILRYYWSGIWIVVLNSYQADSDYDFNSKGNQNYVIDAFNRFSI
jgi:hypothetical protein